MKSHIDTENASDLAALFGAIEKINHRLDKLENKDAEVVCPSSNHPSLDKFAIAEAITDTLLGKEKACAFEPSGKPCDHCSMCNSRGF
jgi:hypothetical protein